MSPVHFNIGAVQLFSCSALVGVGRVFALQAIDDRRRPALGPESVQFAGFHIRAAIGVKGVSRDRPGPQIIREVHEQAIFHVFYCWAL